MVINFKKNFSKRLHSIDFQLAFKNDEFVFHYKLSYIGTYNDFNK